MYIHTHTYIHTIYNIRQNVRLEHLKIGDNHNSAFPHQQHLPPLRVRA